MKTITRQFRSPSKTTQAFDGLCPHQGDLILRDLLPVDDSVLRVDPDLAVESGEAGEGLVDELSGVCRWDRTEEKRQSQLQRLKHLRERCGGLVCPMKAPSPLTTCLLETMVGV